MIAQIERDLTEATLDDVPDLRPRPLEALDDAQQLTTIRDGNTLGGEMFGLLHLMGAHFAARDSDADAAADHLDEAVRVAMLTGERNGLRQHFGPTNVNVWRVAIGVELGQGPAAAERVEREPIDLDTLGSNDPIARDLVVMLDRRAPCRVWELDN